MTISKKMMQFKEISKWIGLVLSVISITTVSYVKLTFVFSPGNDAVILIRLSMLTGLLAVIFAIVSFPRWQAFVTLFAACIVGYMILFTSLYMVP
jgi:hypothetical protein